MPAQAFDGICDREAVEILECLRELVAVEEIRTLKMKNAVEHWDIYHWINMRMSYLFTRLHCYQIRHVECLHLELQAAARNPQAMDRNPDGRVFVEQRRRQHVWHWEWQLAK